MDKSLRCSTPSTKQRCASAKCKKKQRWKANAIDPNFRPCHECGHSLCRYCQHVIINPCITHWETVAENYNPHNEIRPISFFHLLPGENYSYDDYIAFCVKCAKKTTVLSLIHEDSERKTSLVVSLG